ncbi:putative repeat protein (TIGR02543 family) [Lachnotalea glycerini]|uniref:Putative repeat protein (TIGR02543 family) n=1 Tax=Lachnotalea glycerini TaxID=1763509 RepID=A0A318ESC1_9FIRM|nr:Ig-like domain-containing protein [Lachnotalea glycerini]PXV90274.1 putative repeat protein (TIGR02543 family) [Lachnotalea glycerini]
MKKVFSKTLAMLLASTVMFSNTGFTTLASYSVIKIANVYNCSSNKTSTIESSSLIEGDLNMDETTNITGTESEDNNASVTETAQSAQSLEEKPANLMDDQTVTAVSSTTSSSANEASNYTWQGITFGQSTDLDFQSTILPEKIGTQYATETQISVIDSTDTNAVSETKDAVVIESRGGKIANAHDGLTFYYTALPTNKNFVLEAKVFINQFGPENGTTPSKQEAVGVMARDVIGAARQNPMAEGYEELPAASNSAVTMVLANAKDTNTPLNLVSYQRNGVFYPYGNAHISYSSTKFAQINTDKSRKVTTDITPANGESYDSNDFITLRLERNDNGFVTTYTDAKGNSSSGSIDDADRLAIIDKDTMYIGFFASRNAKVTFTDIYLETSDANTSPCNFVPDSYDLSFINLSNQTTSSSNYTVAFRANFDGIVSITQDGSVIEPAGNVTAGEIYELPTTLTKDTTSFEINYISSDVSKTDSFTVTRNEAYQKDLFVSVNGTSTATGDIDSPLDMDTALHYIAEGHTIYLREGIYGPLEVESIYSGSSGGTKTLTAYNGENVIFRGNSYVKASYLNFKGIAITGSNSAGIRVYGNHNTFDSCTFYGNEDTGFQLGMGSDTDPLTWPENNTITKCTSFQNVDASGINADGFAAKLGVGKGNLFDSCISYENADDGWDLFNKLGDAKNEPITIQNCIAYKNGNNGFKLGGEGYAVDHIVTGCLAFSNGLDGFTDNFNTGVLTITNCTSVNNDRYNYIFRLNPYKTASQQGIFTNNISYRSDYDVDTKGDYISGNVVNSYFFSDGNDTITANDFVSVTTPDSYTRNADGTIHYGDYMCPVSSSFLSSNGAGDISYIGAVKPITPSSVLVTAISFSTNAATLKIGESLTINSSVTPDNASNKTLSWFSSNEAVAVVDPNGSIQALAEGNTVITATANDGSNISATCMIAVESNEVRVTSITFPYTTLNVAKGCTEKLTAAVSPQDATNPSITWTCNKPKVATVDENGNVAGKAYGYATVTAISNDNNSIKAICKIRVGYKITYKLNGGTNNAKNQYAYYNKRIKLYAPTRKGYIFKGWYTDKKFTTKITVIQKKSKQDYKLYARWEKVTKPAAPIIKRVYSKDSFVMKVKIKK